MKPATIRDQPMALVNFVEYEDASPEVRAVYDDIMATRKVDWITNFWKALASDPATLKRTWESIKQVMAPGALDALTKEMIYIAVSVTNGCDYCINSHTAGARKAGMSDAMLAELIAVVGMANETNRLVDGYQVEVDERIAKAAKQRDPAAPKPAAGRAPKGASHRAAAAARQRPGRKRA
jgi:AhpD family alkylhydroperoxidase